MDLLSHIFTGVAISSVVANFSKGTGLRKIGIIVLGGVAAAIPDLDVITMWSGFDSTFGIWFGIETSGRDLYFQKHWYSHHGAMHSVFAAFTFPLVALFLNSAVVTNTNNIRPYFVDSLKRNVDLVLTFSFAYIGHLMGDLITPGLSWGGVNLFFPFPEYYGGWEKVWWWNNYDLFLILFGIGGINIFLLIFTPTTLKLYRKGSIVVFLFGLMFFISQVNKRGEPFVHGKGGGYKNKEERSLEIQKRILGNTCFRFMQKVDRLIPFPF